MNKLVIIVTFFLFVTTITVGQNKRGMAYGNHSVSDLQALSPHIPWWYNWSETPENSISNVYTNYGFEFVPMTWDERFNETKLRDFLTNHPETRYLLAFNEPNFIEQANLTPSQVALLWPILESIANDFDLEIVGPAVNFCGNCVTENGTTYTDPFQYLDDFFEACPNCQVDHIAIHSYMNTIEALSWYVNEFKRYNKPIWVTEFAGWESNGNINNVNDQIDYMVRAVDFLESDTNVFRYAWFIGRRDGGVTEYPYLDLLGNDGELTELGEVYTKMPVHDDNNVITIPATIEAEAYNKMLGISLELTEDSTGFTNISWIDTDDWLEYKINVPETNIYNLYFRISANNNSSLNLQIDGLNVLSQDFNSTGGWQNWSTFENNISLTAGKHTIRLKATIAGFNINWIQFEDKLVSNLDQSEEEENHITIFPNPVINKINIESDYESMVWIKVIDLHGKEIRHISFSESVSLDLSDLDKGVYSILISNEDLFITRKVIIQ